MGALPPYQHDQPKSFGLSTFTKIENEDDFIAAYHAAQKQIQFNADQCN